MRSPVSSRALGECNAITSLGVGHRELTFGGSSGIGLRSFPQARFWITSGLPTTRSESIERETQRQEFDSLYAGFQWLVLCSPNQKPQDDRWFAQR
jgi:hypothetical protein